MSGTNFKHNLWLSSLFAPSHRVPTDNRQLNCEYFIGPHFPQQVIDTISLQEKFRTVRILRDHKTAVEPFLGWVHSYRCQDCRKFLMDP